MTRQLRPWLVCSFLPFFVGSPSKAQHRSRLSTAPAPLTSQDNSIFRSSLPNGLRVVIAPDRAVPLVAVSVVYGVGSNDDPPDRDQLAHLLEHLMFRESRLVEDREYAALVSEAGGYQSGQTLQRTTRYIAVVPSNQLEMVLFLESDRMRGLKLTEATLASEKLTVRNELGQGANQRVESPTRTLTAIAENSRLLADTISLAELQSFYDRYYGPSNAVIAIVGDIDPVSAAALVRRYFERIHPLEPIQRQAPGATRGRHVLVQPARKATRVFMAFALPPSLDEDGLRLLVSTLNNPDGQSLRRRVEQRGVVAGTLGFATRDLAEGTFVVVSATPAPNRTAEDVEAAVTSELSRDDLISVPDLEQVKDRLLTRDARNWLFPDFRSYTLAEAELFQEDARRVFNRERLIRSVTAADLQRMVREYLGTPPSLVVITAPSK